MKESLYSFLLIIECINRQYNNKNQLLPMNILSIILEMHITLSLVLVFD